MKIAHLFTTIVFINLLLEWCEATLRYFLYVGGPKLYTELPSDGFIRDTAWVKNGKVKVLLHGYNSNTSATGDFDIFNGHFQTILAKEYKNYNKKFNIILVDWKTLATYPLHEYFSAIRNVQPAGAMLADYLFTLLNTQAIKDRNDIHILGLSMGAHIAGAAGFEFQKILGGLKLGRITGLDPAGPGFATWDGSWPRDPSIILDYFDANFVDIIHSNMGHAPLEPILNGALGTDLQSGHIDFYPNGGEIQKYQCNYLEDRFSTCSHNLAVLFYAQALRYPSKYLFCPCDSYANFEKGACHCTQTTTGQYLGDLARLGPQERYYMTITEPLSRETFEQKFTKN